MTVLRSAATAAIATAMAVAIGMVAVVSGLLLVVLIAVTAGVAAIGRSRRRITAAFGGDLRTNGPASAGPSNATVVATTRHLGGVGHRPI